MGTGPKRVASMGIDVAIEACRREWWATKKFKKFLEDNVAESVWTEQDELFHRMRSKGLPTRQEL